MIGEWTCYGYFIGEGAHETADAWVATTQIDEFANGSTLVSVGTELPQQAGTAARAITGGTGDYALARGEIDQTTNGHNGTDGVNGDFSVTLAPGPLSLRAATTPLRREFLEPSAQVSG